MLIAEWRRRSLTQRVAYLCPTTQLAKQAAKHASNYGVQPVVLIGKHQSWTDHDVIRYERADAFAITTYAALFNSHPHLESPETLVLDDAHAGEQFVAAAWSIEIQRTDPVYYKCLEYLKLALDPLVVQLLGSNDPGPVRMQESYLASPLVLRPLLPAISSILELSYSYPDSQYFSFQMVRAHLDRCFFFVSHQNILIRPWFPPTFSHAPFANANQRLYMSATMGEGGELERAFGRRSITRLPVPPGWDEHGTGRRLFAFPDLCLGMQPALLPKVISKIVDSAGKAVVICPSNNSLDVFLESLKLADFEVLRPSDIENSLAPFADKDRVVLALANRYDGIDLPDDDCRMVILAGLPVSADLQERFLNGTLGAVRVLQERLRARQFKGRGARLAILRILHSYSSRVDNCAHS